MSKNLEVLYNKKTIRNEIRIDINIEISEIDHYTRIFTSRIFRIALETTFLLTDIHREKALSNKIQALRKSTNMGVQAVGILNRLFIRGS